ncbi:hypothetical protein H5T88_07525 [bacterium]|nr:hypothetical protein [bacterium]
MARGKHIPNRSFQPAEYPECPNCGERRAWKIIENGVEYCENCYPEEPCGEPLWGQQDSDDIDLSDFFGGDIWVDESLDEEDFLGGNGRH